MNDCPNALPLSDPLPMRETLQQAEIWLYVADDDARKGGIASAFSAPLAFIREALKHY